jgi:hypothetical protein
MRFQPVQARRQMHGLSHEGIDELGPTRDHVFAAYGTGRVSRRTLLQRASALGLLGAGSSLLAACG